MDDGRYNFPAAESTKLLNHTNGLSGNSFRWGASPISSRNRSNSSTNLINFEESCLEKSRTRNVSKIDPRIAADVGSKGLASRIVKYKYHENESRLNRSMSAHNLYSKPGQFPLVTLKKTDLPYRATKQNVSMTRIAPPEKSMFYGNTLSSLLRSNSVVGLQKSDEDISRENRPIIHPPPTENDMAPTRSVLDVLKEISRKRINSDDLSTTDASKKNRIGNELLDSGNNTTISNTTAVNMAIAANSFKRQRDVNSLSNLELGSPFKNQEINKSPEQITKRVCSYNNDITSSLSSSAKRKPNEDKRRSYQLSQTMPAYVESYETQKVKMQKRHDNNYSRDLRFNNLVSSNGDVETSSIAVQTSTNQFSYAAIPQRSKSEGNTASTIQSTSKPRLTLFNKNYDVCNEASTNDIGNEDNLDESSECAGIHFVKPKKMTSTGLKNPIIERTQKSKLALMLSGLRGELYQEENHDVLDSPKKSENVDVSKVTGENHSKTSPNALAPEGISTIQSLTQLKTTFENTDSSTTQFLAKANSKNASPLVGLKLTPQKAVPGSNISQNSQQVNQINTPVLGGFANSSKTPVIDITNSSSSTKTSTVTTTQTAIVKTSNSSNSTNQLTSFSFGPTVAATNASAATTTQAPFCLGVSIAPKPGNDNKNSSTTTNVSIMAPVTSAPGNNAASTSTFQFGSSASPELKLTPATPSTLQFGSNPGPELKSSSTTPSTFKFGNNPNSELKSKTTAVTSTTTSFTFGASSNPQTKANSVTSNAQFSFNASAGGNTVQAPPVNAFSFGSSSNNNNSVAFTANTTNAASTHVSATSGLGMAPFNQNQPSGQVFSSSVPSAPSNLFGSSNAAEQSLFGRSSSTNKSSALGPETNKAMPTVFGGASVTNTLSSNSFLSKSENKDNSAKDPPKSTGGFTFGTQATKSISNGTYAFGSSVNSSSSISGTSPPLSVAQNKPHFSFSSDTGVSDKKNPLHVFGGSTSGSSATTSTGGFSFGSASTVPKPSNVSSNKPFSFGSAQSNNTQSPVASNSSQPLSNLFALPAATAAFNFGASPSTNIQSNGTPNMTNNIFAASAGSGDRPIRRATRRLQK